MTAYLQRHDRPTGNGNQAPLFGVYPGPDGCLQLVLNVPPSVVGAAGEVIAQIVQASGHTLAPQHHAADTLSEEPTKPQWASAFSPEQRRNLKLGRIAASRVRKLTARGPNQLKQHDAIKVVATELGQRQEFLKIVIKWHRQLCEPRYLQRRDALILRMAAAGKTNIEIAKRLGNHEKTISKWRREAFKRQVANQANGESL